MKTIRLIHSSAFCLRKLAVKPATVAAPCAAAFAGHAIVSNAFPWTQGKYDELIGKQLQGVSEADKNKAAGVAVPIAVKLFKER
jgi:hypothetical protein